MLLHNVITVHSLYVQQHGAVHFPSDLASFCDRQHFLEYLHISLGKRHHIVFYHILLCVLDTPPTTHSRHFLARDRFTTYSGRMILASSALLHRKPQHAWQ